MNRDELLELIPAYAIDALDKDERIEVETLLKQDAEAQSLLQEYQVVASILPFTVPQRPAPAHLRDNLKSQLIARRQNSVDKKATPVAEKPQQKTKTGTARILPFPMSMIASAAAMIIVILGIVFVLASGILTPDNTSNIHPNAVIYNDIVAQANFERFSISPGVANDAEGELVVSADGSQAILRIASLPDTTEEESYQIWLIGNDEVVSGGIFHWPDGHGPYYVAIERPVADLVELGMTIEPFDGSPLGNAPTGERLFGVSIASTD